MVRMQAMMYHSFLNNNSQHRNTDDTGFHREFGFSILCAFLVASCFFFFSCSNSIAFSEFMPVQDKVWDKQAEFVFHFEMNDITIPYNISLQLRNSRLYPYQNLYVIFEEQNPLGISMKDTIECILADSTGKWTGNGITLFQKQFLLKENYHFPDTGTYTIGVRHAMIDDHLKGIENVGILIEKAK